MRNPHAFSGDPDMLESIRRQTRAVGDIILYSGKRVNAYAELYGKGMAKILSTDKHYNAWHLGVNSPGYKEDSDGLL